jgi:2-(1,2-epoxy-1,2-dihydrophenyl)acetyl-CoA isomerase
VSTSPPEDLGPSEELGVTLDSGVLHLRLNRADKRNALNDEMMTGMIEAIDGAGRDESVRVVLISGSGDHFCSGFDIVSRNAGNTGDAPRPRVGSIQRRLTQNAKAFGGTRHL